MNKELLGLFFLPAGVFFDVRRGFVADVCGDERKLYPQPLQRPAIGVGGCGVFFSFSLAVYWLCPNARKKGIVFAVLGFGGLLMYALAKMWLPLETLKSRYFSFRRPSNHEEAV